MDKLCETCGRTFQPVTENQVECISCQIKPHSQKGALMTKVCKDCSQPFEPSCNAQKVCKACKLKNDLITNAEAAQASTIRADEAFHAVKPILESETLKQTPAFIPYEGPLPLIIKDSSIESLARGVLAIVGEAEVVLRFENLIVTIEKRGKDDRG